MGDRWTPGLTAVAAVVGAAAALFAVKGGHQGLAFGVALGAIGLVALWFVTQLAGAFQRWRFRLLLTTETLGSDLTLIVENRGGTAEFQAQTMEVRRDDEEVFSPQSWALIWPSNLTVAEIVRGASRKIVLASFTAPPVMLDPLGNTARMFSFAGGQQLAFFAVPPQPAFSWYGRGCLVRCRIIRVSRSNRHRDYRLRLAISTGLTLEGSVSPITRWQRIRARWHLRKSKRRSAL
jgi:hypothetical protein